MTQISGARSTEMSMPDQPSVPRLHRGLGQGLAAITTAALVTISIAITSWSDPIAPRLVILSFAFYCIALVLGSNRMVGLTSFGVLGSALIASSLEGSSTWVESIVIGCGWYVAVELAWDSIDRRDGAERSMAYNIRRVQELSSVLVICLGVVLTAFLATSIGVSRTLVGRGVFVLVSLVALAAAISHIATTAPKSAEDV